MINKYTKVTLSYFIAGAQLLRGDYIYRERTTKGGVLPEHQRLFIKTPPVISKCKKIITFGEEFVIHAISSLGRPGIKEDFKTHTYWHKLKPMQRLEYHILKYVQDMDGILDSYSIN